jgi:integrase
MYIEKKGSRGSVGIEEKNDKYRIRLPRSVAEGSSRYISTGLDVTEANYKRVQRRVLEIEDDLESGTFDVTKQKYIFSKPLLIVLKASEPKLSDLWESYCKYMKPQIAVTTYKKEYSMRYTNHIESLPTQDINKATEIVEHLVSTLSAYTAKRTIARISSCCEWAATSGLIKSNPFSDLSKKRKLPKGEACRVEPDPFTAVERDVILQAFAEHTTFNQYYYFIKFLFLTGCRTGEAIGLQWKHITGNLAQVRFCESYDSYTKVRKTTKTGSTRLFPCNAQLRELLQQIKTESCKPDDFVFTNTTGRPIDNANFTNRVWRGDGKEYKGIVKQLAEEGRIDHYRKLYCTRHTFITMALDKGLTPKEVASLVGNTAEVIMKHYAGLIRPVVVPEI